MPDPHPPIVPVRVRGAGATSEGPQRNRNEDAFAFFEDETSAIAVVADGMGHARSGDHAAAKIVDACAAIFRGRSATVLDELAETWWVGEHGAGAPGARVRPFSTLPIAERVELRSRVRSLLEHRVPEAMGDIAVLEAERESLLAVPMRVLQRANADVHRLVERDPSWAGVGAAGACVLFAAGCASIAHAGDCRVSRVRGASIEALTAEHTLRNELEKLPAGQRPDLTPEEIEQLPSNVITRVIGMDEKVQLDTRTVPVERGDLFVLATDGFWRAISEMELLTTVRARRTGAAAYLVERGSRHWPDHPGDNLTAVVVEIL